MESRGQVVLKEHKIISTEIVEGEHISNTCRSSELCSDRVLSSFTYFQAVSRMPNNLLPPALKKIWVHPQLHLDRQLLLLSFPLCTKGLNRTSVIHLWSLVSQRTSSCHRTADLIAVTTRNTTRMKLLNLAYLFGAASAVFGAAFVPISQANNDIA